MGSRPLECSQVRAPQGRRPKATNRPDIGIERGGLLRVFALRRPKPAGYTLVNTTSHAKTALERGLSPFNLGPVPLYDGTTATSVENAWQFGKVYSGHTAAGAPTDAYFRWARAGWSDPAPRRFPMGRGARPLYMLWAGQRLGYIEARARVYAPVYAAAVAETASFRWLKGLYETGAPIGLVDFDGWDHVGQGFTLAEALAADKPKMGHAFVLAGMLQGDLFWLREPVPAQLAPARSAPQPAPPGPASPAGLTDDEVEAILAGWADSP